MSRPHFASASRHGHIVTPAQQAPVPVVTVAVLAPAAGGGSRLPATVIFETAAGPPLRLRLPPAGAGAGELPLTARRGMMLALAPAAGGGAPVPPVIRVAIPAPPQPPLEAWQRDAQRWAIHQERERHAQALWQYGELAVFLLMWATVDLVAGLATRCQRCFTATRNTPATVPPAVTDVGGSATLQDLESRISAAYGQGNQYKCPDCFGTQFEGGFRAMIVRPAVFSDLDKNQQKGSRGVVNTAEVNIETTPDFRVRSGDYCFRQDGARFQLRQPRRTTLRTGFGTPYQASAAIDYNLMRAALEDPTSVAYIMPPSQATVAKVLGTYTRLPVDFSWFEVIRAPLIPEEQPPPAALGLPQPDISFPLEGAGQ